MRVRRGSAALAAVALVAATSACSTTTGAGRGLLVSQPSVGAVRGEATRAAAPVAFEWSVKASEADAGVITAKLSDGSSYRGKLQRLYTRSEEIAQSPYFGDPTYGYDWQARIAEHPGWDSSYGVYLADDYADSAMATLQSDVGTRMNCKLRLLEPALGLRGGARGDCQLSSGEAIHDVVLAPR